MGVDNTGTQNSPEGKGGTEEEGQRDQWITQSCSQYAVLVMLGTVKKGRKEVMKEGSKEGRKEGRILPTSCSSKFLKESNGLSELCWVIL